MKRFSQIGWMIVVALLAISAHGEPVWFSDRTTVYVADGANDEVRAALAVGGIRQFIPVRDGAGWAITPDYLVKVRTSGETAAIVTRASLGLQEDDAIIAAADARSGSLWLAAGTQLMQLDVTGRRVATFTFDDPVQALAVDLDQSLWLMLGGDLRHMQPDGSELSRRALSPLAWTSTRMVLDSVAGRLWLASGSTLLQFDLHDEQRPELTVTLPQTVQALAFDPELGRLWVLGSDQLFAIARDGDYRTLPIGKESGAQIQFDAAAAVLWTTHNGLAVKRDREGLVLRQVVLPLAADRVNVQPFSLTPTLSLKEPKTQGIPVASPASLVFDLGAQCNGRDCSALPGYFDTLRLEVNLNDQEIGPGFAIDAAQRTASYVFDTTPEAGNYSLRAQARDVFGNRSAPYSSRFVLTGPAAAVKPKAGSPPVVSLTAPVNNTVVSAPATVTLTATASETGGTISKVEFYRGTTLLGSKATSPYTFAWSSIAAGTYSLTAKATDSTSVSTTSAAVTLIVNALPTVSITAPANNSTFATGSNITLSANASDSDGTIAKVDFYQGTTLLGTSATSPYTFTWNNVAAGTYSLTAKATDNRGGLTTSSAVAMTVHVPPTVSLTAPANNTVVTAPGSVTLSATASETGGTISKVEFFQGSALLGSKATTPYTFAWSNIAAGSYTLTAKATDAKGLVTTSSPVTLIVNAAPSVSLTAPANNTTVAPGTNVVISANASDSDGTITKVDFYRGSTFIGTAPTPPYSFTWNNVAIGTYTITARATDNRTVTTTSAPITLIVKAVPSVSLTAPASNTYYTAPANITLTAVASEVGGTIKRVEFYQGATMVGSDSSAPYTFAWKNVAVGNYTLTAKAIDLQNTVTTSAAVAVSVGTAFVLGPITITQPAANGVFYYGNYVLSPPYRVTGTVNASGPVAVRVTRDQSVLEYGATLTGNQFSADIPVTEFFNYPGAGSFTVCAHQAGSSAACLTDPAGNQVAQVNFVAKPLAIQIDTPGDNTDLYSGTTITVSGRVDGPIGTTVQVAVGSASPLDADMNGNQFSTVVALADGPNGINVTATMPDGGVFTTSVTVNLIAPTARTITITSPTGTYPLPDGEATLIGGTFTGPPNTSILVFDGRDTQTVASISANRFTATFSLKRGPNTITATALGPGSAAASATRTLDVYDSQARPVAVLTSPTACASFPAVPAAVPLAVSVAVPGADSPGYGIGRVNYYAGQFLIASVSSPPYQATWNTPTGGDYVLTAQVMSADLYAPPRAVTTPITIHVGSGTPPSCTVTSPADNSVFGSPTTITLTADARANASGASIAKVDFYQGTTLLGTATQAPYSYAWVNARSPYYTTYTVSAVATDSQNSATQSAPIRVDVSELPPLQASITTPRDNQDVTPPFDLWVGTNGAPPVTVRFLDGTTVLDTQTIVGYGTGAYTPITAISPGTHTLTAKVSSGDGQSLTTAAVHINVVLLLTVDTSAPTEGSTLTLPFNWNVNTQGGVGPVTLRYLDGATQIGTQSVGIGASATLNVTSLALGAHTLTVRATDSQGWIVTSAPVHVTVAPAPLTVAITAPANGTQLQPPFVLGVTTQGGVGPITLTYLDGTTQIATQSVAAGSNAPLNFAGLAPGLHTFTVRASDSQGTSVTSAAVSITVSSPPTVSLASDASSYFVPATVNLLASANAGAGSITEVDFYQGANLLYRSLVAPYGTQWNNVPAGSYTFTAVVKNSYGGSATSAPVTITVSDTPSLDVDTGFDGSSINDDNLLLSGRVNAPLNSAVSINGRLTALDQYGNFFANAVQLTPGSNTITLTLTTQDGVTVTKTITVNSTGPAPFTVAIDKQEGLGPLTVNFTITNRGHVPFQRIEVDLNNDGIPETTITSLTDDQITLPVTYPSPGIYTSRVTVFDAGNTEIYTATGKIYVYDPQNLVVKLLGVYNGMLNRLRAGNISTALTALSQTLQPRFQAFFTQLGSNLSAVLNQLGTIDSTTFGEDFGELILTRTEPDGVHKYTVDLVRGFDGIWRIDGM